MRSSNLNNIIAALIVTITGVVSFSCRTADSRTEDTVQLAPPAATETPEPIVFTDGNVVIENVAFYFERDFIEKVEVSELPTEKLESEEIKPDNIRGRTLEFTLKYRGSKDQALISVFKIAEYKEAFARFPQYLEQRDGELGSLIKESSKAKRWGIEVPFHVRWIDADHYFYSKAQIVKFDGGRGLLMLTQIGQDAYSIINNDELEYFFQGMTDDGVYFVEMSFPANMNGLPRDGSLEFAKRYNLPEDAYYKPEHEGPYRRYTAKIAKEIDSEPDNSFVPIPSKVRAFIEAFRVK